MQEYGPLADEWSVGMLMYQLLTGVFPFWDSVQNVSLQQVSPLRPARALTANHTCLQPAATAVPEVQRAAALLLIAFANGRPPCYRARSVSHLGRTLVPPG